MRNTAIQRQQSVYGCQSFFDSVYDGCPQGQVRVCLDDLTCHHLAQTLANQLKCYSLLQAQTVERRQVSLEKTFTLKSTSHIHGGR